MATDFVHLAMTGKWLLRFIGGGFIMPGSKGDRQQFFPALRVHIEDGAFMLEFGLTDVLVMPAGALKVYGVCTGTDCVGQQCPAIGDVVRLMVLGDAYRVTFPVEMPEPMRAMYDQRRIDALLQTYGAWYFDKRLTPESEILCGECLEWANILKWKRFTQEGYGYYETEYLICPHCGEQYSDEWKLPFKTRGQNG